MHTRLKRTAAMVALATVCCGMPAIAAPAPAGLPDFQGASATPKPLPPLPMPRHPIQNNDGYSGAHGDSYNSHAMPVAGPLGRNLKVQAYHADRAPSLCSNQHFDAKGRIIAVCVGRKTPSDLLLLDPETLKPIARHELPPMAGFYFRMDQQGRVMIPSGDMSLQLFEIDERGGTPAWRLVRRYDLSAAIPNDLRRPGIFPIDVVADWRGNWWFSVISPAAIGYVTPAGEVHSLLLKDEKIENGLAADPDGIYFVSNKHLYGTRAGAKGVETFIRFPYEAGRAEHSISSGSGTTPTIFGNKLIAFGDNADPRPNALVYRLDDVPDEQRLVCKVPVFKPGRSVLENSFIGYDHALVIENNMGFTVEEGSPEGEPGFVRIDVRRDLSGCDVVWESYDVRAGTGPKLSLPTGLIYVHELLQGTNDAWYVTAIDFHTGKTAWRKYVGSGKQWDNAMLTMSIGPQGLLTSGMYAGVLAVRDTE